MPTESIQENFDLAFQHQQAGRLHDAELLYRQILAQQPEHARAWHYLGVIAGQTGHHDMAVKLIRRAIAREPNWAKSHYNLGNALRELGQLDEAIAAYRQALAIQPGFAEALINLGNVLKTKGKMGQAIAAYRQAIAGNPQFTEAHFNLANALQADGQVDEAISALRQVITLKPDYAEAYNNLGNALQTNGQVDLAVTAWQKAIALRPRYAEAHCNLGQALKAKGRMDAAIAACRQAVALSPKAAEAYCSLGNVLKANGQMDEAIATYRQAIALKPTHAQAYNNLGVAQKDTGQMPEAIAAYRQAIALKPDLSEAHNNLGNALKDTGQLDEAITAYRQAITLKAGYPEAHSNLGIALKDVGQLDAAIAACRQALKLKPDFAGAHSNLILAMHYHPSHDAAAIAQELARWNQQYAAPLKKLIQPHTNDRNPARRLRIGYVSPDFRQHVVAGFLQPLLAQHNRQNVEVFAYAQVPAPDAVTEHLRGYTDAWRNLVGLSDAQAAELIRQDQIDILLDLALHSANSRLLVFAHKPAPVQVSYLGYAGSTGLAAMDYRFSDPYLDPPGMDEAIYTEQTWRLPETYWCYQPVVEIPLPARPLPEKGAVTFGCLNNFCKVNKPLLSYWARLLAAVPQARLLLHAHEGSHRRLVVEYMQRQGIAPGRVGFVGKLLPANYFATYQSIDIALDTHPYGGGTTTCDALWMGVPVVSLAGKTAVGRAGVSLLSNVGLPELVAKTPEEYVQIAAALANDPPRLRQLGASLRQRMQAAPLMDAPRFAGHIESAYRQMWQKWCAATPNV